MTHSLTGCQISCSINTSWLWESSTLTALRMANRLACASLSSCWQHSSALWLCSTCWSPSWVIRSSESSKTGISTKRGPSSSWWPRWQAPSLTGRKTASASCFASLQTSKTRMKLASGRAQSSKWASSWTRGSPSSKSIWTKRSKSSRTKTINPSKGTLLRIATLRVPSSSRSSQRRTKIYPSRKRSMKLKRSNLRWMIVFHA